MNINRLCVRWLLPIALAACATGPKYTEMQSSIPTLGAEQGRVYFYRSGSAFGAAVQPSILLNGVVVGESKPGGFFFVDQAAGNKEENLARSHVADGLPHLPSFIEAQRVAVIHCAESGWCCR